MWGDALPVSGGIGGGFGWHSAEPYLLDKSETDRFREFWTEFRSAQKTKLIRGALHRFGLAAERVAPEDEMVDLMIAAETLFLTESSPRDRGEVRYRLSMRAAAFLGSTVNQRVALMEFMRDAYDLRSTIVHGGTPAPKQLRGLDRQPIRINLFADELEQIIREALQKTIRETASGRTFPPHWETLILQ